MKFKKMLAVFLATVMMFSLMAAPVSAIEITKDSFELKADAVVTVDGTADQTVEVVLSAKEAVTIIALEGAFSTKETENSSYFTLTNYVSPIALSGTNYFQTSSGAVVYADAAMEGYAVAENGNVMTAVYTVSKDTPAGRYTVSFNAKNIQEYDFNQVEGVTYTATIEVKAPEAAKTGFEVYYELENANDADDNKYADCSVGDIVTANVYLVNHELENVQLQAYDIYLEYGPSLDYAGETFDGKVYTEDGTVAKTAVGEFAPDRISHIQLVAEDGVKIDFPKGEEVLLGSLQFEITDFAEYGVMIPIELKIGTNSETVTNIAVGKTGVEGGDKTSYYPVDVSVLQGVEIDNVYTVTFYDGTDVVGTREVGHNKLTNAITAPEKADYTFGGWYADEACTTEFDFATTKIKADTNIYAKYEQNTVQVIWKSQDGKTELKSAAEVIGTALKDIAPAAPAKGEDDQYTYTFAGWATSANQETGTMPENLGNVTEAVTYYAAYSKAVRSYTVNFYNEDGTKVLKTESVAFGTAPTAPSTPTKEGNAQYTYQFAGWAASKNGEVLETLPNVGGAADYYAVFTEIPVEYTVTWNVDGTVTDVTVAFGDEFPAAPADPVKNGYKFDGWDVNGDGSYDAETDVLPTTMPENNVTIKAVFSLIEYTITFNLDGGTMDNDAPVSMTYYVTDAITLPTASKNAFSFGGWEVESTDATSSWSGTVSGTVAAGQYGNVTLKAVWSEKPLDIEVVIPDNVGGSASVENQMGGGATAEPGDEIKISVVPQPGYVFDEEEIEIKYEDENGEEQVIKVQKNEGGEFIFTIPEDLKAFGNLLTGSVVFTALEYEVVFDKNAVDATDTVESITATFNEDIQLDGDVYSRPGYEFLGWSADKNAAAATYAKDALIEDNLMTPTVGGENTVTLYAVWEAIDYTVTVEDEIENGDVSIKDPQDTYNIGDDVTLVVTPDEGFEAEITVTYKDENGVEYTVPVDEDNTFDMPAGDVTVNVVFKLVDYTINVDEGIVHGTVTAPATANMGETVELTVAPADGYELDTLTVTKDGVTGDDAAVTVTDNKFTMPASDVTVTATFKLKELNINKGAMANGDVTAQNAEGTTITTAKMGDIVTLVAAPANGYQFASFTVTDANNDNVTVNVENGVYTFEMPATDVTVTATFNVVTYTITLDVDGGKELANSTISYDITQTVTLPVAEKDGYTFNGWLVIAENGVTIGNWGANGNRHDAGDCSGMYGDVELKADWSRAADPMVEEYKYAQNGYVMLRVKAPSAANMEYQFNGESMYYIDNEYYNIEDSAVFYTLIPVEYYDNVDSLTDEGYALLKQVSCNASDYQTVNYVCDINQDGVVNVADANAVYQMTQFTGKYYSVGQFDTERRLSADLDKGTGRNTNECRGSIEDVHVIINEINGVAQTNG